MFCRIESDDSEFDKYRRNWKVHVHHDCGRECRINDVCGMLESSYDKHRECFRDKNVTFGFSTVSTRPTVGSDAPVHNLELLSGHLLVCLFLALSFTNFKHYLW